MGDDIKTSVNVNPLNQIVGSQINFNVDIYCVPSEPIKAYELRISFDETLVQADSVVEGNIFDNYSTFFSSGIIDNDDGTIINIFGLIIGPGNVSENVRRNPCR